MKLLRVQVPDFRVLKDVDITFEPDFVPNIFPIGSQNGGGKSTLLQIIFILLHCSSQSQRHQYIKNLLSDFNLSSNQSSRTVAKFDIFLGSEINLHFFVCRDHDTQSLLSISEEELTNLRLFYVCNYSSDTFEKEDHVLTCGVSGLEQHSCLDILDGISKKIFLLAPSTQVFLFSSKDSRAALFKGYSSKNDYIEEIIQLEEVLSGFLTYSFLNTGSLISLFKSARDEDFKNAIVTDGSYGSTYKSLINDLEILLGNKRVIPDLDLGGVQFRKQGEANDLKLNAEDLSHGELKRLSIYAWLKQLKINDAVVLMDELEIALHLDWQYQIVSDLSDWAPSNQYLLATHSYELCQALTPAHVKQIPPNLISATPTHV